MQLNKNTEIAIVGAGLVGSLLAIYMARKGFQVEMFERRPDMRKEEIGAGRSINLAVSTRGLLALRDVGLEEEVLKYAVPMRGRMIHSRSGELTFQRYGKDDSEHINSISRASLNKLLMTHAEETRGVKIHFNQRATGIDLEKGELFLEDTAASKYSTVIADMVLAADGAASPIRDDLIKLEGYRASESVLNYGYKELVIPPGENGSFLMERNALHIWPRGSYMLIALPNYDGSYTCTLFLPFEGELSFDSLKTKDDVENFFQEQFSDAVPLIADLSETFFSNPTGRMVTVKCEPWNFEERVLLLGDAAHAIVPFFGQGMNCGFEDLTVLAECMERHVKEGGSLYINRRNRPDLSSPEARRAKECSSSWSRIFQEFFELRKQNTDAIADMAVENFIEMRDKVVDKQFQLEKAVEKVLQREFPGQYYSRYALVTFSNTPYSLAMQAGLVTDQILGELCRGLEAPEQVDLIKAKQLIESKLAPVLAPHRELLAKA